MKRIRNADAKISSFTVTCPYKACGYMTHIKDTVKKGDVAICINCRKPIKIRRITC